jgi:nicotinamidase-related amidase
MAKRAVIAIDIQNDYFPGGKWPLVGIDAAADKAAGVLAAARAAGDLVVHVRHEFPVAEAPFFVAGTEGVQTHPKVAALPGEPVVVKNYVNSFHQTNLKEVLDAAEVKDVVILGAMSHMCIDAATRAAIDHGYGVTVIHDACATHDQEFNGVKVPAAQTHAALMAALAFAGAAVTSSDELAKN